MKSIRTTWFTDRVWNAKSRCSWALATTWLRQVETAAKWQIARRTIILDQATVLARNLSFFF